MRRRALREQGGFTLPEMLVTIVIMLVVLFALYSIFDMSIRVFSFGNNKVEAVENARLGLEKMTRELRGAYPVKGSFSTGTDRYLFFNANGTTNADGNSPPPPAWPTATQITFGNERSSTANSLQCGSPCEYITYKLTSSANPSSGCSTATAPCTLRRVNAASSAGAGDPVVEFVRPDGLRLRYFAADGTEINPAIPGSFTTQDISRVEITLRIEKDGTRQDLTTQVNLRNPGRLND